MEIKVKEITNKIFMGRRLVRHISFLVFILLFTSITPATADPPIQNENECLIYSYSESGNHLFLLGNNKTLFGNNITIIHNCQEITVNINGNFSAFTTNNKVTIPINYGINDIQIINENKSYTYKNVTFIPDRLSWELDYYDWQFNSSFTIKEYIELSKATAQANWASILSIVVVFCLTTLVYWHLINAYVDKNYFEEVID